MISRQLTKRTIIFSLTTLLLAAGAVAYSAPMPIPSLSIGVGTAKTA
jgi:hypothetical protein